MDGLDLSRHTTSTSTSTSTLNTVEQWPACACARCGPQLTLTTTPARHFTFFLLNNQRSSCVPHESTQSSRPPGTSILYFTAESRETSSCANRKLQPALGKTVCHHLCPPNPRYACARPPLASAAQIGARSSSWSCSMSYVAVDAPLQASWALCDVNTCVRCTATVLGALRRIRARHICRYSLSAYPPTYYVRYGSRLSMEQYLYLITDRVRPSLSNFLNNNKVNKVPKHFSHGPSISQVVDMKCGVVARTKALSQDDRNNKLGFVRSCSVRLTLCASASTSDRTIAARTTMQSIASQSQHACIDRHACQLPRRTERNKASNSVADKVHERPLATQRPSLHPDPQLWEGRGGGLGLRAGRACTSSPRVERPELRY